MPKVSLSFSLDNENDKKILDWLNKQDNRSGAIRDVLASHLEGSAAVDVGTVHRAVLALSAEVCSKLEALTDKSRALDGGVNLGDVYGVADDTRRAVGALERKLANGAVIVGAEPEPEPSVEVPEDVTANLWALADLG